MSDPPRYHRLLDLGLIATVIAFVVLWLKFPVTMGLWTLASFLATCAYVVVAGKFWGD